MPREPHACPLGGRGTTQRKLGLSTCGDVFTVAWMVCVFRFILDWMVPDQTSRLGSWLA